MVDFAISITLTRELVEAVHYKLQNALPQGDLTWPSLDEQEAPRSGSLLKDLYNALDDDSDDISGAASSKQYWQAVLARHTSKAITCSPVPVDGLPEKWAIVHIGMTDDQHALIVSRQRPKREPIVFYIPLKGRRENDEEEHFTYGDAVGELKDIIQCSDESTRNAVHIKADDREAKASWWADRKRLDKRLKELLENIEFCWLGAFKVRYIDAAANPNLTVLPCRLF